MRRLVAALILLFALGSTQPARAQSTDRPLPVVEFHTGWTGFADDATIDHAAFGGTGRFYLSPRVSVGPEITYLRGPRTDRDLMVTGNVTFDLLRPRAGRQPRVSPFLIAGAGIERHSERFGLETFSSSEGAFTGGGGVRVWFNDRVYGMMDTRIGWEPHVRIAGGIGVAIR